MKPQIIWFKQLGIKDIEVVGGKNASLGEMISNLSGLGVKVPDGFATLQMHFVIFCDNRTWIKESLLV